MMETASGAAHRPDAAAGDRGLQAECLDDRRPLGPLTVQVPLRATGVYTRNVWTIGGFLGGSCVAATADDDGKFSVNWFLWLTVQ